MRIETEKCPLCGYERKCKVFLNEEGRMTEEVLSGDEKFRYTSVVSDTNRYYAKYKHFLICPKCGVVLLQDIVKTECSSE